MASSPFCIAERDPDGNEWTNETIKEVQRQARKNKNFEGFQKLKDFQKRFLNRRNHLK